MVDSTRFGGVDVRTLEDSEPRRQQKTRAKLDAALFARARGSANWLDVAPRSPTGSQFHALVPDHKVISQFRRAPISCRMRLCRTRLGILDRQHVLGRAGPDELAQGFAP